MILDSSDVARIVLPETTTELADAVRSEPGTLAPVGSGSALGFGNPLASIDCVIQTTGLGRITEYVPADLTVHVEAGTRLGDLQNALGEHNQMIPLDPWFGRNRTIGGIVATNAQGPFRTVGTVRDWIIGMTLVHADGKVSRTGGRVVKNVSGYDLAKLYTGSLGSLGIISEVSFKVSPRHQRTATARVHADSPGEAWAILQAIRSGPLNPISLVWFGPDNGICVRFGDSDAAVRWQIENLPQAEWQTLDAEAEVSAWDGVAERYRDLGETVVRLVVGPSRVAEALRRLGPERWLAHAATGIVLMPLASDRIDELRRVFPVIVERAPLEVRQRVATFGITGPQLELMARVKRTFDPDFRLNPGRHVDGEGREGRAA